MRELRIAELEKEIESVRRKLTALEDELHHLKIIDGIDRQEEIARKIESGMSYREVATIFEISPSLVGKLYRQALHRRKWDIAWGAHSVKVELSSRIDYICFETGARNSLIRAGIKTVDDAINFVLHPENYPIRGFGKKSMDRLVWNLEVKGFIERAS